MLRRLLTGFVHVLVYLALTLSGLLWLSDTLDESPADVQSIGRGA